MEGPGDCKQAATLGGVSKRPRGTTLSLMRDAFFIVGSGGGVSIPPRGGEWRWGTHHCSPSPGIKKQRLRGERRRRQSRGREVEVVGFDATTSRKKRDDSSGGSGGDCDGNGKCCAAAIAGFGNNNYDDAGQRPLRWRQFAL